MTKTVELSKEDWDSLLNELDTASATHWYLCDRTEDSNERQSCLNHAAICDRLFEEIRRQIYGKK